jgi:hypothetical protein
MGRTRRALVGILAAALLVVGGAVPALAAPVAPAAAATAVVDPGDGCENPSAGDGYAPPTRCELRIVRAVGTCLESAPVLDYAVEVTGSTDSTVTITWVNPGGEDLVQEGLPLSGRVFWPGTVIMNGVVVDWPGWVQAADGTWTLHDAYDFTRPTVQVVFEVNPEASTVVSYPPESAACANPPTRTEQVAGVVVTSDVLAAVDTQSQVLAVTGANTWPLLAVSGGLVLLGAALVATSVRRRHAAR